jgi:hypothetical protein
MSNHTLPIDRPLVAFTDEDAPTALVPQGEPAATASGDSAVEAAAVLVAEAAPSLEVLPPSEPASPEGETAVAGAAAAAATAAGASGGQAAAASAAVAGKGGGGQSAGAAFQLSEDVGLAVATFSRGKSRPANPKLLKLFVTDDLLVSLWNEIGRAEQEVVALRSTSPKMVAEMFDRLTMARNLLLSDRDEYEDALHELNVVKNNIMRVRNSNAAQRPFVIQLFLYAIVAVSGWLFVAGPSIATLLGNRVEVVGIPTQVLWNSVLWGGIGGLSAALYALVKHVEDYDPQHAVWYYVSPIIGLFFGPLVALLADVGLPAIVQFVGSAPAEMEVRPAFMYILAWAVGFKQNLLIQLINGVLARVLPGLKADGEKAEARG